jgi:serine/threonine-protein kinase
MDFTEKNKNDWKQIISDIFPSGTPENSSWTSLEDIINVLKKVGSIDDLNHMFYPNGGGLDLTGADRSKETGCIELHTGGLIDVIKPQKLSFEKISEDNEWSYFRIETDALEPSGVYESNDGTYEEVTEIEPNQYVNRSVWDQNEYQGQPLPKTARVISRYFNGAFVIFRKTSIYNKISSTYDGRHSKMTADEFRAYIQIAASK